MHSIGIIVNKTSIVELITSNKKIMNVNQDTSLL